MNKIDIKNHLVTASYGKFDFIPAIIPKETLLIAPPRIIVSILIKELELSKSDIPGPALRSWLHLYRKKEKIAAGFRNPSIVDSKDVSILRPPSFTDDNQTIQGKQFDF
jgi:hypothetical protein